MASTFYTPRSRQDAVANELLELRKEYGFSTNTTNTWANFYLSNSNIKTESVKSNIALVKVILSKYGFNEEEIVEFIEKNKYMVITNTDRFKSLIALFYHFGLLESALFKCPNILGFGNDFFSKCPINIIYALLQYKTFNDIIDFRDTLCKLPKNQLTYLNNKYPYRKGEIPQFWKEFINDLKSKKLSLTLGEK